MSEPAQAVQAQLRLIDEAWREFRSAVDKLVPAALGERVAGEGWTRIQMLAHIAAWHDVTTHRINAMRETGAMPGPPLSVDGFNADIAAQNEGTEADEAVRELDLSYQRLRAAVVLLSDEQLRASDAWAVAILAGNTYEHYPDHIDDLTGRGNSGRGRGATGASIH
jgi:hypothetical protein